MQGNRLFGPNSCSKSPEPFCGSVAASRVKATAASDENLSLPGWFFTLSVLSSPECSRQMIAVDAFMVILKAN